ncbi:MAG: hypothetical protein JJU13_00320 [Balneolaceae bacterium]|nr:hypothetical protein [Balneolaceae bacterium]
MSDFLIIVHNLLQAGSVKISEHGYDELANDNLSVSEILNGVEDAKKLDAVREALQNEDLKKASKFGRIY